MDGRGQPRICGGIASGRTAAARLSLPPPLSRQANDLFRHWSCHSGYVRRPAFERLLALIHKLAAIVDAGDAATRAADVIDGDFDDVRRHAQLDHAGDERPSQIMQRPWWND